MKGGNKSYEFSRREQSCPKELVEFGDRTVAGALRRLDLEWKSHLAVGLLSRGQLRTLSGCIPVQLVDTGCSSQTGGISQEID